MNKYHELTLPNKANKLLLHSCCAPCSSAIMELLLANNINYTVFFYNPNIHPTEEYELRKNENLRFANKYNIPFVDLDNNQEEWFKATKHLAAEPERGKRCTICFNLRLEHAAIYCVQNNFTVFTSSLGISRHKDMTVINNCGINVAARYNNLTYWTYDWRKVCSPQLMAEISQQENFYRQKYCGCVFSFKSEPLTEPSK